MPLALVAIGSNLGERHAQLDQAVALLGSEPGASLQAVSRWHETPAIGGPAGQGAFLNGAILLETSLGPEPLRLVLDRIERQLGRERDVRWQARKLDLDLLLYDDLVLTTDELVVPHPRMAFRRFVLEPAAEIAPRFLHPSIGWSIGRLLEHLNTAPRYLAITGIAGVGKTRLLDELSALGTVAGIRSPDVDAIESAHSPGSPVESQIKWPVARACRLQAGDMPGAAWVASDFWLGQSLAYGSVTLGAESFARFAAEVQTIAEPVPRPKLIVVLTAPDAAGRDLTLQSALLQFASQPGVGPLLVVSRADWPRAQQEVTAALTAME